MLHQVLLVDIVVEICEINHRTIGLSRFRLELLSGLWLNWWSFILLSAGLFVEIVFLFVVATVVPLFLGSVEARLAIVEVVVVALASAVSSIKSVASASV